ncbi:tRNA (adenosine(37)-N6)-threonylcarbamoyltransferase complex ATPase subunit type 1 TsaE, partial [Patescibacteria group bacterium]|nr:tRNA (adenosine(37)-N6)-threonylcarbamoyltransferase complex ATPase subunit type 1 TsaE [Patescibacteria group bacterium]
GGEMILLYGDLGAGKTVFVKGLAKALGIVETVKSPTFNILKCYDIPKNKNYSLLTTHYSLLCHIDAYRLESVEELLDIGIEDYIDEKNIIIVEWADRVRGIEKLAEKVIKIKIEHGKKEEERGIEING